MSEVDIPSILAGAYDAALQDHLWEQWSLDLFRKLGGSGGLFGLHDTNQKTLNRIITLSAPPRAIEEYVAGYYQFDPQIALVSALPGSDVYVAMPGVENERREVADYLRWQKEVARMPYHQTAVMTLGDAPFRASICIHKAPELGAVTRGEHRTLRRLAPQLERALRLSFQHGEKLQSAYWDGIIIGRSDQIAFLIDERGRVIRHTDAADALIARRDGLDVIKGHLAPINFAEVAGLNAIVARATRLSSPLSGAMRINRASGQLPLILVCYPLQRNSRMIAPLEAAALVTVTDPHLLRRYPSDLYRQAFRLTLREAEMVEALMIGHSVESAAAMLGMSMPTARTHMRRIFEKTGTAGQSSLIRLLSKIG